MRRDGDQIVLFAQHLKDFIADMQAKQPGAFDKEAYFIFAMGMLIEEFSPQRLFLRIIRPQANDIPALVALFSHQFINRMLIGRNNGFSGWRRAQVAIGLPALEAHPFCAQLLLDFIGVAAVPAWMAGVVNGKNS